MAIENPKDDKTPERTATKSMQFVFETDTNLNVTVGESPDIKSSPDRKLALRIRQSLNDGFGKRVQGFIQEIRGLIERKSYSCAWEKVKENAFFFDFAPSIELLTVLKELTSSELEEEKEFLLYTIQLSTRFGIYDDYLDSTIDIVLDKYKLSLNDREIGNLLAIKGDIARISGMLNVAVRIYNEALQMSQDSSLLAGIYEGLSKIAESDEEKIKYLTYSSDRYLETGNIKNHLNCLVNLARVCKTAQPKKSLSYIESAITLSDDGSVINKEIKAQLLFMKTQQLAQIGDYKKSLTAIREVCDLRSNMIGVERSYCDSLYLGSHIAKLNNEFELRDSYKELAESIGNQIDNGNIT